MTLLETLVALLILLLVLRYGSRRCEALSPADWGGPWINRLGGCNRLFCRNFHRARLDPIPLPESGPALVVCNHLSGLDPLLLVAASPRPLRFLIAREEYERPWLKWLLRLIGCIPVDRSTRPELALRAALRALQAGEVIALFPEGRIRRPGDPPPRLKGGVAWLSRQAPCTIFPTRVSGIRGKGKNIAALFIRNRQARLESFPQLECRDNDHDDCLEDLSRLLLGE